MSSGKYFGELALIGNTTRTATVSSIKTVKCLAVGRSDLENILGDKLI